MNLATNISGSAAHDASASALKLDDSELSFGELETAVAQFAALLDERGIGAGDRVAVMIPNVPEFVVAYFGTLWAGAELVPVNVLYKQRELEFILRDSSAATLVVWAGFAEQAQLAAAAVKIECVVVEPTEFLRELTKLEPRPMVDRAPDNTAVIIYTSGTTGNPKGAELTHANLLANTRTVAPMLGLYPGARLLGSLPLFHAFGALSAMNTAIFAGARLSLLPRFDPARVWEIIHRDQIEVFLGVPTMYNELLHVPDISPNLAASLRLCVSGGASLPVELLRAFEQTFCCAILEGYGLSECSPVATFNPHDGVRKPGSVGPALPGVEVAVFDDSDQKLPADELGEIVVRGPNVMKGYLGQPDATAAALRDGWLHTGDLGYVDTDGYFFIVDRKQDIINRGGQNIYPREIEEVIYEHPAIREVAVVGLPDELFGEQVGAAVALKPGAVATEEELRDWVKQRLAAYKYPRQIWFLDALPHGGSGKVLRREVAANRLAALAAS